MVRVVVNGAMRSVRAVVMRLVRVAGFCVAAVAIYQACQGSMAWCARRQNGLCHFLAGGVPG